MKISRWIRFRIAQQTNIREDNIKLSMALNSIIMKKHLKNMKPLKVNISIEKDIATVTPFEIKPAAAKVAVDAKGKPVAPAATTTATAAPAKTSTSQKKEKPAESSVPSA